MRLIAAFMLLAASYAPSALAQSKPAGRTDSRSAEQSKQPDSEARLQFTASIVERRHVCSNFMGFRKVRLTFKNVGGVPVILDKRSFLVGSMVSRDLEAAAAKQYQATIRYFDDGAYFNVDPSNMSTFVVLKPGEVYEKVDGVGSFFIDDQAPAPKGRLSPGTYFLQIKVSTWSYFADSEPFRERWKDKGILWLELMTSEPMPFTAEKNPSLPPC